MPQEISAPLRLVTLGNTAKTKGIQWKMVSNAPSRPSKKNAASAAKHPKMSFGTPRCYPRLLGNFIKTENTHKTNANPPKNTPGPTPPEPRKWEQNNPEIVKN